MGARPADGADVQPLAARALISPSRWRDINTLSGGAGFALDERRHEMLAGHIAMIAGMSTDRRCPQARGDPARPPGKSQINGRHRADGFLECG
jgi:hypothetical protein